MTQDEKIVSRVQTMVLEVGVGFQGRLADVNPYTLVFQLQYRGQPFTHSIVRLPPACDMEPVYRLFQQQIWVLRGMIDDALDRNEGPLSEQGQSFLDRWNALARQGVGHA